MSRKVERNYLEINSIEELNESNNLSLDFNIELVEPDDFKLNKFFYKNIGKSHHWVDRLAWTDKQWNNYTSDRSVKTFVLKKKDDLAGYFELIIHKDKKEVEKMGVHVGCVITYPDQFQILNKSKFVCRAIDNRAGGFMIAEVARLLKEN